MYMFRKSLNHLILDGALFKTCLKWNVAYRTALLSSVTEPIRYNTLIFRSPFLVPDPKHISPQKSLFELLGFHCEIIDSQMFHILSRS